MKSNFQIPVDSEDEEIEMNDDIDDDYADEYNNK